MPASQQVSTAHSNTVMMHYQQHSITINYTAISTIPHWMHRPVTRLLHSGPITIYNHTYLPDITHQIHLHGVNVWTHIKTVNYNG